MLIRDLLVKNKVQELKDMAKIIGLTGYSKLKKDELIASIGSAILNEEYAKKVFFLANDREIELFEKKLNETVPFVEEEIGNYVYLYKSLFYFLYEENEFVIPEGLKEIYEAIQTSEYKEKRARFQLVYNYGTAMTNMYGIVPVEQVVKVFNEQNEVATNKEELVKAFELMKNVKGCIYDLVEGSFVHEAVLEEGGIHLLLEKQGNKPYYIPAKEVLLCYEDETFFERSKQYETLKQVLENKVTKDAALATQIAAEIQYMYSFGEELAEGLVAIENHEFEMEEEVLQVVVDCLVDLYNNTRFWENRGFTPKEMSEMDDVNQALNQGAEESQAEIDAILAKAKEAEEERQNGQAAPVQPKVVVKQPKGGFVQAIAPMVKAPTVYPTFMDQVNPTMVRKVGRNESCPCGSGQKYKRCCGK